MKINFSVLLIILVIITAVPLSAEELSKTKEEPYFMPNCPPETERESAARQLGQGNNVPAMNYLVKIGECSLEIAAESYFRAGSVALINSNHKEALKYFLKATDIDPENEKYQRAVRTVINYKKYK